MGENSRQARRHLRAIGLCAAALCVIGVGATAARSGLETRATDQEVAALEPELRAATIAATRAAAADGVEIRITSGRRTREEQRRLFEEAIEEYGSPEEASRWVIPPDGESAHFEGKAIDVAPKRAAAWLRQHGAAYGLCQVYANEAWHFELIARGGKCPALLLDATDRDGVT